MIASYPLPSNEHLILNAYSSQIYADNDKIKRKDSNGGSYSVDSSILNFKWNESSVKS